MTSADMRRNVKHTEHIYSLLLLLSIPIIKNKSRITKQRSYSLMIKRVRLRVVYFCYLEIGARVAQCVR